MKRALPLLLTLFLAACSNLGKPPLSTPEAATAISTFNPPSTFTSIPPASTIVPASTPANTNIFPNPSAYHWTQLVSGMALPDDIQFPDDGTGRMFIIEQGGRIRIIENGQMLDPPFLDIINRVGSQGDEQGFAFQSGK